MEMKNCGKSLLLNVDVCVAQSIFDFWYIYKLHGNNKKKKKKVNGYQNLNLDSHL